MLFFIAFCIGSFLAGCGFITLCVDLIDGNRPVLPLLMGACGIAMMLIASGHFGIF